MKMKESEIQKKTVIFPRISTPYANSNANRITRGTEGEKKSITLGMGRSSRWNSKEKRFV